MQVALPGTPTPFLSLLLVDLYVTFISLLWAPSLFHSTRTAATPYRAHGGEKPGPHVVLPKALFPAAPARPNAESAKDSAFKDGSFFFQSSLWFLMFRYGSRRSLMVHYGLI